MLQLKKRVPQLSESSWDQPLTSMGASAWSCKSRARLWNSDLRLWHQLRKLVRWTTMRNKRLTCFWIHPISFTVTLKTTTRAKYGETRTTWAHQSRRTYKDSQTTTNSHLCQPQQPKSTIRHSTRRRLPLICPRTCWYLLERTHSSLHQHPPIIKV